MTVMYEGQRAELANDWATWTPEYLKIVQNRSSSHNVYVHIKTEAGEHKTVPIKKLEAA